MNEYLHANLNNYLHQKISKKISCISLIIINLFIICSILCFFYTYNTISINAEVFCEDKCKLHFYLPITESVEYKTVKIKTSEYEIEDIKLENVMLVNSGDAVEEVTLEAKEYIGIPNEIVSLQLQKNKEKIFTKIVKIIMER